VCRLCLKYGGAVPRGGRVQTIVEIITQHDRSLHRWREQQRRVEPL
jgi:hypothetical protein